MKLKLFNSMDQSSKGWKIYRTLSIPLGLHSIKDPFVQELLQLWEENERKGYCYTAYLYTIPVGFILLEINNLKLKTIRGTWVDENYRGQGIGNLLMREVLGEFEHQPVDILVNITKGAEGFYEKYGFKIVGHREDFDMNIGLWESLTSNE